MASKREKPQPELRVPLPAFPAFPLSSPITEEISSPSCSSAEDRDFERNRPFDFLVRATRQKLDDKSGKSGNGARPPRSPDLTRRDRPGGHSIRGISKRRTGKPVGLSVVTDFSLQTPPKKQHTGDIKAVPFVDLNDLKQLCKAREKERSAQKAKPAFKRRNSGRLSARGLKQSPEETSDTYTENGNPFLDPSTEDPAADRTDHGLSPSDRHVMIGLAVPRDESSARAQEFDSADNQHTHLAPSIIVTPAREDAPWSTSGFEAEAPRPRPASSVYSQPTPRLPSDFDIPPVPAIPAQHTVKQAQIDSEFLSAHFAAATQERKRRSVSAETIIEDNSSDQQQPQTTLDDDDKVPLTRLSINTEASRPQSLGWWTYLLSPLLGKKSPLSPTFPRGGPSTSKSTEEADRGKEWWEKEVSCFSPDTPETTMTEWWNDDGKKSLEQPRDQDATTTAAMPRAGNTQDGTATVHNPGTQTSTSFTFGGQPIQGEAAEYYQACAHELFSKAPYFECFNHVCSITPSAEVDQVETERDETRVRALVSAEAGHAPSHGKREAIDGTGTARRLLIKVDASPKEDAKHTDRTGPTPLVSGSDSDGRPSTENGNHEKGLLEPSASTIKEPAPAPASEPAPATVSAPVSKQPIPLSIEIPREQASVPPPQVINNVHYAPPPTAAPPQPAATAERELPRYIAVFPPSHDGPQRSEWPWKVFPQPHVPRSSREMSNEQHAAREASPISPGFQRAAGGPGSIPLPEVQAPAPAYTQYARDAALPPRYDLDPAPRAAVMNPTGIPGPEETRRRRLEREDAVGRKFGGLWRGRGCFSNKGCFGRPGREGRLRRRWYLAISAIFLIIVALAIALATTLTKHGYQTPVQSAWLNLTGYPPIPTGIATIAGAETQDVTSSCINPSTLWRCALPQDQQSSNKPYPANSPSFHVEIRFRNGTYDNSTAAAQTGSNHKFRRNDNTLWTPDPAPPSIQDQIFLGNTTDGNSVPYSGEETPFYMSILSPIPLSSATLYRRSSSSNIFPNLTTIIPTPAENPDGTAAAPVLYPLPDTQPIRLYNRGEPDEHYGFYTYFDKSIFLASRAPLSGSATDGNLHDLHGGVGRSHASVRCTWSQTRFLVQIWTQPSKMGYTLLGSSSPATSTPTPTLSSSFARPSSSATDNSLPGSFPYPVTITLDRHGGIAKEKMVYCYAVEDDGHYNVTDVKLQLEDRGFGGSLVNPASGIFDNLSGLGSTPTSSVGSGSSSGYGGIDGGTGGCLCRWVNWVSIL